jgi:hypothetical protein
MLIVTNDGGTDQWDQWDLPGKVRVGWTLKIEHFEKLIFKIFQDR